MLEALEIYKVAFETIAAAALTVMAILVSAAQLRQMKQQNRLVAEQVQLARSVNLPLINVYCNFVKAKENDITREVVVENLRGPARQVRTKAIAFIETQTRDRFGHATKRRFPLWGYFLHTSSSSDLTGHLATKRRQSNHSTFHEFLEEVADEACERDILMLTDLNIYLRVRFVDVYREEHEEYFAVGSVGEARRIDGLEIANRFEDWKDRTTRLNLEELDAKRLVRAALESPSA